MELNRLKPLLLAVLVVVASVPAMSGSAAAAGPTEYTYTTDAKYMAVNVSALDAGTDFTVEFKTHQGPKNPTILTRKTLNTATVPDNVVLSNDGAYDNVTVTVSSYSGSAPTFDTFGSYDVAPTNFESVGHTGGDQDITCDAAEKISTIISKVDQLDCTPQPGSTDTNVTGLSAEDAQLEIYASGQNDYAAWDNFNTSMNNYLQDSKTQALILGKNAYIEALNNGQSESAARTTAKDAVRDYYSVKQENIVASWNRQANLAMYLGDKGINSSATDAIDGVTSTSENGFITENLTPTYDAAAQSDDPATASYTTSNGTTLTTQGIGFRHSDSVTSGTSYSVLQMTEHEDDAEGNSGDDHFINGFKVNHPTEPSVHFVTSARYMQKLNATEDQSAAAVSEIDTLVTNTYTEYQEGDINNTDLVDPYVLQQQQSAGDDFQGWTAAQLTMLGTNSPEAFDQIGSFSIVSGSQTYEGVLFSQSNPASGQFENGTTYDTANISGTQYVVTADDVVELSGSFTIERIEDTQGNTKQNATIKKVQYQTTNVTELQTFYEDLLERRAEIEARETNLNSGGGGALLGNSSSVVLVGAAAAAALLLMGRDNGGRY